MNFGRKINPNRLLVRGILTVLIGITIVAVPGLSLTIVMQGLGLLLLIDGLVAWLVNYYGKKPANYIIVPKGTMNFLVGTLLVLFPTFLVNVFVFVIGLLLILAGTSQFANQIGGRSAFGFSWLLTIISFLALITGITLIAKPFESAELMLTVVGVVIGIYGIGEIILSVKLRKLDKEKKPGGDSDIQDVDYEEIKE